MEHLIDCPVLGFQLDLMPKLYASNESEETALLYLESGSRSATTVSSTECLAWRGCGISWSFFAKCTNSLWIVLFLLFDVIYECFNDSLWGSFEVHLWLYLCYLSLSVPANIYKVSEDITINEGNNVTLTCLASGRPEPMITWRLLNPSGKTSVGREKERKNFNFLFLSFYMKHPIVLFN